MTFVVGAKNVEKPSSVLGAKMGVLVGLHVPSSGGRDGVNEDGVDPASLEDCVSDAEVDGSVEESASEELMGSNKLSQLLNTSVNARGNKTVQVFFILQHYTKSLQMNKGETLKYVCK
jgi:hypothetical protein